MIKFEDDSSYGCHDTQNNDNQNGDTQYKMDTPSKSLYIKC